MNYAEIDAVVTDFVRDMVAQKEREYADDVQLGIDPALGARCFTLGYVQSMLVRAMRAGGSQICDELLLQMKEHQERMAKS